MRELRWRVSGFTIVSMGEMAASRIHSPLPDGSRQLVERLPYLSQAGRCRVGLWAPVSIPTMACSRLRRMVWTCPAVATGGAGRKKIGLLCRRWAICVLRPAELRGVCCACGCGKFGRVTPEKLFATSKKDGPAWGTPGLTRASDGTMPSMPPSLCRMLPG